MVGTRASTRQSDENEWNCPMPMFAYFPDMSRMN
jgi:hypothetical protein